MKPSFLEVQIVLGSGRDGTPDVIHYHGLLRQIRLPLPEGSGRLKAEDYAQALLEDIRKAWGLIDAVAAIAPGTQREAPP